MTKLDQTDKNLIALLGRDGRETISSLAENLGLTAPTVRSRLKSLIKTGVLRLAGLVNAQKSPELTVAIIAIDIDSHGRLDEQLQKISELEQVHWAAVVTGQFDVILEVVVSGGMDDIYKFTTEVLPQVGRVTHSETFVVMKARNKWLHLPQGIRGW